MTLKSFVIVLLVIFVLMILLVVLFPEIMILLKENVFMQSMLGTLLGTLIGASIITQHQIRIDRYKCFQALSEEGQKILSEYAAWEKVNGEWVNVEFRKAVGLATWQNNPNEHLNLHTSKFADCKSIKWSGVAYRIDDNYCVTSKALHDYATWLIRVMDSLSNKTILNKHACMMWRILADALYPAGDYISKQHGMGQWVELILFDKCITNKEDLGTIDHKEYKKYRKLCILISKIKQVKIKYSRRKALEMH